MTFYYWLLHIDTRVWADQQGLTLALCGHWMQSRRPTEKEGLYGERVCERERERGGSHWTPCYQHNLMMIYIYIYIYIYAHINNYLSCYKRLLRFRIKPRIKKTVVLQSNQVVTCNIIFQLRHFVSHISPSIFKADTLYEPLPMFILFTTPSSLLHRNFIWPNGA